MNRGVTGYRKGEDWWVVSRDVLTSAAVIQGAGKHQVSLRQGATAGATPEEAFFVRCDAETNAVVDALSECEIKDGV